MSAASEQGKCGLSSLFPMSCRDRAEAFARHLHSRLQSLGAEDAHTTNSETSWLTAHENAVSVAQPRHVTENNLYLNLELLESPGSPEEEITERELSKFFTNTRDNLTKKLSNGDFGNKSSEEKNVSQDSDDLPYYDTEDKLIDRNSYLNGHSENGDAFSEEFENLKNSNSNNSGSDSLNDINVQVSSTCDASSLSSFKKEEHVENPKDEDGSSLEYCTCTDDPKSPLDDNSNEHLKQFDSNISRQGSENVIESKCHEIVQNVQTSKSINERRELPDLNVVTNGSNSLEKEEDPSKNVPSKDYVTDCKENYKTDATTKGFTESNDNTSECQQASEEIKNKDCSVDNLDSIKYSSFLTVDKSLSLTVEDSKCETTFPQTAEELHALLQETKNLPPCDDSDEKEIRTPRVRRCSSLKTGKTPPGTPGRKKIVRFADVLGLDLADVRTFLDEIPKVPISAYEDLKDAEISSGLQSIIPTTGYTISSFTQPEKILMSLFQQPGGQPDFLDRVRDKNVCLENAVVKDPVDLSVSGTVRVRNLDFNKSVHIRYTIDGWKTFADLQASYVSNSCDGFSDKFTFLLYAHTLEVGQRLEFAIRFHCKGCQYWDNNNGVNYMFQCLPGNNATFLTEPSMEETWGTSFYYEDFESMRKRGAEVRLSRIDVQDYICQSLEQRKKKEICTRSDAIAVAVIVTFSILFLYIYR